MIIKNLIKPVVGKLKSLLIKAPEEERDVNCWTIHLIPLATVDDKNTWLTAPYIGPLNGDELKAWALNDAIEQGVISDKRQWRVKVETGVALRWNEI